jgi:hypothetical protein
MAAKLKTKRTSITTMGAKIQAFDIFQTPLSSHYPLPLRFSFCVNVLLRKLFLTTITLQPNNAVHFKTLTNFKKLKDNKIKAVSVVD